MTTGTGLAFLGIWGCIGACAFSARLRGIDMMAVITVAFAATVLVALWPA